MRSVSVFNNRCCWMVFNDSWEVCCFLVEHLVHAMEVCKAIEFLIQAIQHVAYLGIAVHTNDKSKKEWTTNISNSTLWPRAWRHIWLINRVEIILSWCGGIKGSEMYIETTQILWILSFDIQMKVVMVGGSSGNWSPGAKWQYQISRMHNYGHAWSKQQLARSMCRGMVWFKPKTFGFQADLIYVTLFKVPYITTTSSWLLKPTDMVHTLKIVVFNKFGVIFQAFHHRTAHKSCSWALLISLWLGFLSSFNFAVAWRSELFVFCSLYFAVAWSSEPSDFFFLSQVPGARKRKE